MPRTSYNEKKRRRSSATTPEVELSRRMDEHIQSLKITNNGFKTSPAEYKIWCDRHGFSRSLNKTNHQMREERELVSRIKAQAVLEARKGIRKPREAVVEYLDERLAGRTPSVHTLPRECQFIAQICDEMKSAANLHLSHFAKLVQTLAEETDSLFEPVANAGAANEISFIKVLANVCYWQVYWIRDPKDWKAKSHNTRKQFSSLIRHLFCKYEVPSFLDKAWHTPDRIHQEWFIHLGLGENLRTIRNLPVKVTKKVAHYFCQAPDSYSPSEAIRYGQILSLGGTPRLAESFRGTRVIEDWQHDEFWQTVFCWFIDNPMLDLIHVGPICDWLHNQKYAWQNPGGINAQIGGIAPPQPNLSMKKRDPESTLRAVEAWHKQLGRSKKNGNQVWEATGIKPFYFEEGSVERKNYKVWTITELLSTAELRAEGTAMQHCVGSYSSSCASGRVSIWSLKLEDKEGVNRRVTIEVANQNRAIVQARTKRNMAASVQDKNIIQRWANEAGLTVGVYMWGRAW